MILNFLEFTQVCFWFSVYICLSLIGRIALDKLARLLKIRPFRIGWIISLLVMPVVFPIVFVMLLATALIARVSRRKNHGFKNPRDGTVPQRHV